MSEHKVFDLFIIGGGINGCGIARDAAGRGLSVALAEKADLASGTSSGSTKLIHGGLRYLEHYEFGLVRKALAEREVLWQMAPHITHPLRFIMPHQRGLRPGWLIRLGMLLYDHLGKRRLLPPSKVVHFDTEATTCPLKPHLSKGYEYSDCWVDDARLVILNARDAANQGAQIMPQTKVTAARRQPDKLWHIDTRHTDGTITTYQAKVLINASGPWIDLVQQHCFDQQDSDNIRLVRGSHIVVPKLFDHAKCYIFQNPDGRIIFAIPYEEDFTLIGTTDADYVGDPGAVCISQQEIIYLCAAITSYFKQQVTPADIVWSYSAVRPLLDDGENDAQSASRDYKITIEQTDGNAPLININGGKITTYRKLAEDVLQQVRQILPHTGLPWTANSSLPGGQFTIAARQAKLDALHADYPFLTERHARRLLRQYGTDAWTVLQNAVHYEELGQCFGSDLYECEVTYQVNVEWATCANDIVWRRTKEGLRLTPEQIEQLDHYISNHVTLPTPSPNNQHPS